MGMGTKKWERVDLGGGHECCNIRALRKGGGTPRRGTVCFWKDTKCLAKTKTGGESHIAGHFQQGGSSKSQNDGEDNRDAPRGTIANKKNVVIAKLRGVEQSSCG